MGYRWLILKRVTLAFIALVYGVPVLATAVGVTVDATVADTTPPTITISDPTNGTTYTSATIPITFTGTAADNSKGVGLAADSTLYTLQRQSDSQYWNGATWVVGQVYQGTTHPGTTLGTSVNWSSNSTLPPWLDDTYILIAQATDRSGNTTTTSPVTFSINTVTLGLITISRPVTSTTYTAATIPVTFGGTVHDAANGPGFQPNIAQFYIQRESDGLYWDGNTWVSGTVYLSTTHSGTTDGTQVNWSSNALLPSWLDGNYLMQARAVNRSGNTLNSSIIRFTIDNGAVVTPPGTTPPGTTPPGFPPTSITEDTPLTWITSLPNASLINLVLGWLFLLGALFLALLPTLLQLPLGAAAMGPLAHLFAFFLAWLRRRRRYGIVFNSSSRDPVENATVRLIAAGGNQFEVGKLLQSKKTDSKGRFTFDIPEGLYRIEVIASEFQFPSSRASIGYRGEVIEVTDKNLIYPDIPIDSLTPEGFQVVGYARSLWARIQQLRIPLSILGTIFAISFFIERGATIDYVILAMYIIFWILEYFNWLEGREVAFVTADGKPVQLTTLRLYDSTGQLRNTRVTDSAGRYAIFAATGHYLLDVLNRAFDVQSIEIRMRQTGIIPRHIRLHRLKPSGER